MTCGFQPAVAEGELADEIRAHMEKISFTPIALEEDISEEGMETSVDDEIDITEDIVETVP